MRDAGLEQNARRHAGPNPGATNAMSRRGLFGNFFGYALVLGASLPILAGHAVRAQEKASKQAAQYQEQPKDGHSCGICQFFHAPKTCQLVDGDVSPDGWCSFWAKKV